jgi:hypothetical protein
MLHYQLPEAPPPPKLPPPPPKVFPPPSLPEGKITNPPGEPPWPLPLLVIPLFRAEDRKKKNKIKITNKNSQDE